MGGVTNMSIYNEYVPSEKKPFKTVTVEYFEEFENDDSRVTPKWQGPGVRRIRIVTTTCSYNLGSAKGDPVIDVTYEYL
jgi:hypothetical protein